MKGLKIFSKRRYFHPGEKARMRVGLKTDETVRIRKAVLEVTGVETCREDGGGPTFRNENSVIPDYSSPRVRHDIMTVHRTIAGMREFSPGKHFIPFSFEIPEDAFPSYSGHRSWIRYEVHVSFDIPMGFDLTALLPFRVVYDPAVLHSQAEPVYGHSPKSSLHKTGSGSPPGLFVELDGNVHFAGGEVTGRFTLNNLGAHNPIRIHTNLQSTQQAFSDYEVGVAQELEIDVNGIRENVPIPFSLSIPRDAETTLQGYNCRCDWVITSVLHTDPFFPGIEVRIPIAVYQWDQDGEE